MKKIILPFLILFFFFTQVFILSTIEKPVIKIDMQDAAINIKEEFSKFIHFGHERLISSILWVVTLIESDTAHHKEKGKNSWMFYRFNTISTYDPLFYENYFYGGQYLSIIKDDLNGAEIIYDKGIKYYPNDLWLNHNAAFHYYYEMGKRRKGMELFNKVVKIPYAVEKIPILLSIVAKMNNAEGRTEDAYNELLKSFNNLKKDSPYRSKLESLLYSLKAKVDIECLNKNLKNNCDHLDHFGKPYSKKEGLYIADKGLLTRLKLTLKKGN